MALSKEVRIGILAVSSIVIFFTGFYFLKGANVFSNDQEFYCYYPNVDGLLNSANVQIDGLNVGRVSFMKLDKARGVKVTIAINRSVELHGGTVASLVSADLLGTKIIRLDPGNGPDLLKSRAELPSQKEGSPIDNMSGELTPRLRELKTTISSLDTTLASVNALVDADNQRMISEALRAITLTAQNMAALTGNLKNEAGEMTAIVHNANSITANLASKNDTISRMIDNLNNVSRQLANAPIQKSMTELQETMTALKGIVNKINSDQGSLGLLINNKDLYYSLNSSLRSVDSLMKDLKAHPSRYINVTVFGKSSK